MQGAIFPDSCTRYEHGFRCQSRGVFCLIALSNGHVIHHFLIVVGSSQITSLELLISHLEDA